MGCEFNQVFLFQSKVLRLCDYRSVRPSSSGFPPKRPSECRPDNKNDFSSSGKSSGEVIGWPFDQHRRRDRLCYNGLSKAVAGAEVSTEHVTESLYSHLNGGFPFHSQMTSQEEVEADLHKFNV